MPGGAFRDTTVDGTFITLFELTVVNHKEVGQKDNALIFLHRLENTLNQEEL
jgi:hypothetical protein